MYNTKHKTLHSQISKIFQVQENLSLESFTHIYGKMGAHMWKKYNNQNNNCNLLSFIFTNSISDENKELMLDYIKKQYRKK